MSQQYNHWFWNGKFVRWASRQAAYFSSWLWRKQYGEYKNNFWHKVGPQ